MAINISFPNFLCLLLTMILFIHILTRDPLVNDFSKTPENVELLFCKLPQSLQKSDSKKCSSIRRLFYLLENDCSFNKRPKRSVEDISPQKNETEASEIGLENEGSIEYETEEVVKIELEVEQQTEVGVENKQEKEGEVEEKSSSLVDSFVIVLLIFSAIVSVMELYKEKIRKAEQHPAAPSSREDVVVSSRRISLADLTVNRHIRRRDSQHHNDLLKQTSSGSKPPLLRRSSFPAQLPDARPRHSFQRQQSHPGLPLASPPGRRMSVDLGEDDSSPDRRRVRIIRRH